MADISNTSKVIKGVSSQTVVTMVLGLVEIISFSIMSRLLTQEDFGYYAVITAITAVFATFAETGIGSALVQQKELSNRYINNAFTISLLFGSFISILLLLLAGPLSKSVADESIKTPLMLMSGTLLLNCLTSVNNSMMHRKLQFLRMGLINLISLVITSGIAILLAYKGYGYYAIITKAVLGSVITYVLSFVLCNTHFGFALDGQTFKKIFSFSGWLMASSLFRNLAHQIDRLLMPRLLSVSALGAYNRPKDFIEQMSTKLNGIFDTALFPVLSGIQDDKQALKSAFQRSMYVMNIFALLLTLAFLFNSGLIIRVFFGEHWVHLTYVLMVISCSLLFNIDGRLADCYLRSLAMTKEQFYFRVFETVLKTLGVVVGFRWNIMGVALSVVITNFVAKIVKILYVGNKVDVKAKDCIGIILSSWRYALILLPVCITALLLLPNSWIGDIVMAVFFVIVVAVVFLAMPGIVGKQYEKEVYMKINSFLSNKLKKKTEIVLVSDFFANRWKIFRLLFCTLRIRYMQSISTYLKNPRTFIESAWVRFGRLCPDKLYLKVLFRLKMGYKLNLKNPKTFSEKLQWLKLYDHNPNYTKMVDKYAMKEYVAGVIGDEYVIPTLGVWDRPEDIEWDNLPEKFVLKTTHDGGGCGVVICNNKSVFNKDRAINKLSQSLHYNTYKGGREWPYKNVPHRIIAEKYIDPVPGTNDLPDYKFFCFDGKVNCLFIATDRHTSGKDVKFDFYDADFNHLPFRQGHENAISTPQKPRNFEMMKQMAAKLSKGIPQVRIDFYEVGNLFFIGEITFFHFSGMMPFNPKEWDRVLGDMITLPEKRSYGNKR